MKHNYEAIHKPSFFVFGTFVHLRLGLGYDILANKSLPTKPRQRYVSRFKVLHRVGRLAY
ncbi:hypothetical protein N7486_002764 [Penicillium sp. IBT 16267x]|nr:hypothetical protein N7486_002764 [Penicillium sp. IBT 16267x]